MGSDTHDPYVAMTAELVAAYVSKNPLQAQNLKDLIFEVYSSLRKVGNGQANGSTPPAKPAVNPKRSVFDDYIVCLEDGKRFKSLKRHLMAHYNMTPDQYREKWGLPADYPMVSRNYSAARSALAKANGLGNKVGQRKTRKN